MGPGADQRLLTVLRLRRLLVREPSSVPVLGLALGVSFEGLDTASNPFWRDLSTAYVC